MTESKIVTGLKEAIAHAKGEPGARVTVLKTKGDYSEHVIIKEIDGKPEEFVNIDAMTEDQFKQFCRDTGTEWFQRLGMTVGG